MDKIKPQIMYAEIEYYLHGFGEKEIENNDIYALARTLSDEKNAKSSIKISFQRRSDSSR